MAFFSWYSIKIFGSWNHMCLEIQIQNHYVLLWTHCNVVVLKLNTKHVQTFWKEKRTALKDMPYLNFSTSNFRVVNLWVLHTLHSTIAEIFISIEIRYFGGDNKLLLFFPVYLPLWYPLTSSFIDYLCGICFKFTDLIIPQEKFPKL